MPSDVGCKQTDQAVGRHALPKKNRQGAKETNLALWCGFWSQQLSLTGGAAGGLAFFSGQEREESFKRRGSARGVRGYSCRLTTGPAHYHHLTHSPPPPPPPGGRTLTVPEPCGDTPGMPRVFSGQLNGTRPDTAGTLAEHRATPPKLKEKNSI